MKNPDDREEIEKPDADVGSTTYVLTPTVLTEALSLEDLAKLALGVDPAEVAAPGPNGASDDSSDD